MPEKSHRRAKTPDLAFADTVVVDDLADAMPLSSDLRFNDETGIERRVHSVAFPPLDPSLLPPLETSPPPPSPGPPPQAALAPLSRPPPQNQDRGLAGAWRRMRKGVRAQREELTLLWSATAALDADPGDPTLTGAGAGKMTVSRRLRTLLSFFEWDRADVLRAAWIGLAVFFLAATIGAIVLRAGMP